MDHTKPNDRFRISHTDGSVTALDNYGHVIGWTEHSPSQGWSALWRTRAGDRREFVDTPERAAVVLRNALAEETQQS